MITRFNKFIVLMLTFFSISGYCQKTDSEQTLVHRTSITSFDLRSKELVGSIYIDENFLPAKLSDSQNNYLIRYDAYQDEMEVEKNGNNYHLSKNPNYTINFEGTNKSYQVYNYSSKNEIIPGFFVILYKGDKISLLRKEKIKFFEEVIAKTGYDKYKPPTLKRIDDKIYIGYKNSSAIELPSKKKDILYLFASKTNEIESFAKENNLGFKSEEDLIKIFNFYHSLN